MKPKTLLILAMVVALLAAFIWFVERDLPSTDERGERARKILPIDADGVTAVEIRHGESVTRLEKAAAAADASAEDDGALTAPPASEWRLVQPMAARADADAVDDLVDSLTRLEKERTLEDVDTAALGLARPRATVTLATEEGERVLHVGAEVPASSNVIVGRGDASEAFVVADSFWSDLTRSPGEWRSREAFAADRDAVRAVRLRGAAEVALRRTDDGFELEEPFVDEASADKVDELMAALTGLEVASFLDGPTDAAALGLAPAAATVTVNLEGAAEPVEIALGSPAVDDETARYVELDDQRFTAKTDLGDLADLAPDEWRSTEWTRREVYEVDAVEVRRDDMTLRLVRDGGAWRRDEVEIPYTTASDLLYALRDAKAVGLIERAATGPGPALYEIVLTTNEGAETLLLYAAVDGGYPAERVGRDALLLLDDESVDELVAKIDEVRRAEPVPAPEPDAEPATG